MIPAEPPTIQSQDYTLPTFDINQPPDSLSFNLSTDNTGVNPPPSPAPSPKAPEKQADSKPTNLKDISSQKINLNESIIPGQEDLEAPSGEKEQKRYIPPEFYYDQNHIQTTFQDSSIEGAVTEYHHSFGFDSFKRFNVQTLDQDNIVFASGTTYTIYNHFTHESRLFFSKDRGGIGSIAVHPSRKYFAVAEKGQWPNIYVYEFPSLKLYRVMRKGTEKAYSNICFNAEGNNLASVGSKPDYQICVWDWMQEVILLKAKAFSQEVYRVSFCHFNQAALITSGMGHIKFWKIAETFTGLKLQGEIAKFGQIELSDVSSFIDFEDGKVLSSSEYGKLLLWEGNLIKCVISIDEQTPCHNGSIEVIMLQGGQIVTAGVDGFIRFWDYEAVNTSESDEEFNFFLKPLKEIYFEREEGLPAHIINISPQDNLWMVQDALGKVWKLNITDLSKTEIMETNSGKFNSLVVSSISNIAISAGADGYVRVWDYGNKREFYHATFKTRAEAVCVEWIPYSKKNAGRMIAVGFSDGLLRVLLLAEKELQLVKVFKLLKRRIIHLKCSSDGGTLAAIDDSGDIFLCSLNTNRIQDIVPYCLYETGFKVNDVCWDRNSAKILLGCKDGTLQQIKVFKPQQCDNSQTYLKPHNSRGYLVRMMQSQKPKREDLELELLLKKTRGGSIDDKIVDEEWEPSAILGVMYYDTDCTKVLCAVDGKFLGHLYIVDWGKDRPISSIKVGKEQISYLGSNEDILLMGFTNGSFELRHKYNYDKALQKYPHDRNSGRVVKVAFNHEKTALLTTSEDGTIFVYKIDYGSFCRAAKSTDLIDVTSIMIPPSLLGLNDNAFVDTLQIDSPATDMTTNTGYSIQEEKLKAEEDNKMTEADKVKLAKRRKIQELQNVFNEIVETNNQEVDEFVRLSPEELVVDPEFVEILNKEVQEEIEETSKELAYDEKYAWLLKDKIQSYMVGQLEYNDYLISGIHKDKLTVQSFKLKKMSQYMLDELEKINKIIEEEKREEANPNRMNTTTNKFGVTRNSMGRTGMSATNQNQYQNQTRNSKDFHGKIREAEEDFEKELQQAEASKGDYKLKSVKDYMVPESQRLNVARKKKHMFLHYNYLFNSKKTFNEKLLELKKRKEKIIEKILRFNKRFQEINAELGINEDLFAPKIEKEASDEISNEEIEEFSKQKKARENKRGSTGGMGGGATEPEKKVERDRKKSIFLNKEEAKDKQAQKTRKGMKQQISQLQGELREINEIMLLSEKDKMQKELHSQISLFDKDLAELKEAKSCLEIDLKLIEMKLLTEYQQFLIFRDMEEDDNRLLQRLNTLKQDKINLEDTSDVIFEQISQLEIMTQELRKKVEQQKKIFKELVFPEDDEKRDRILRYYKSRERKRLNRARRQNEKEQKNEESQSDEEGSEEEENSEESEGDDEFDEDEEKPDITPIETDHKNFDLIRKICEHDQKIDQNTKQQSDLEKQKNQVNSKIKAVLTELLKVDSELKVLQKKKLVKVNNLDVTYPLKISQIEHLIKVGDTFSLPEELNSSILFTSPAYERLANRIKQLKKQKIDIEKKQLVLEKQLGRLKNQVKKSSVDIETKKKEYEEKQLLKFGDIIDLKILEALEPTKDLLQTRQRYKHEQKQASKRIEQVKTQLQQRKKDLLHCKKQNTRIINDITELGQKEMSLNKKLDSTNKQLFRGEDEDKKNDLDKERNNLKDLIKFLSKEIEDLKTEIGLFKRKGGHIYTMVTSNKRNFT